MTRRKSSDNNSDELNLEVTEHDLPAEDNHEVESTEHDLPAEDNHEVEKQDLKPAEVELITPQTNQTLAPAQSKEEIAASIQEKLSRKTDKDGMDPFVPSVQLENEVKEIASKKGFPLSRGTEIGARLMARAKRTK